MKDYPSIPRAIGQAFREIPNAYVFDKLDGTSHRTEWSRSKGWHKHGLRHTRNDENNPLSFFAQVPTLFSGILEAPLNAVVRKHRWQTVVAFYEFWGPQSLAGFHVAADETHLTLFDVAVDDEFLDPGEFRKLFEDRMPTAAFLGRVNWTRGYVDIVRKGEVEGITSEGVVAKLSTRREYVRAKAKTQAWIDRVIARHGADDGRKLVES
jgi:hypothetical protein